MVNKAILLKSENGISMRFQPLKKEEWLYVYSQSMQLRGQTGSIGYLRGDFGASGNEFFSTWRGHQEEKNTSEFKREIDEVINTLRFSKGGLLSSRSNMCKKGNEYPESIKKTMDCSLYGFRIDTDKHAFLIRCIPMKGSYNFYCYCYISGFLDSHMKYAEKGIRFIDSDYHDLFRIPDGEAIIITTSSGEKLERTCRYIDETHAEIGIDLFHICQFAELMEKSKSKYSPKITI